MSGGGDSGGGGGEIYWKSQTIHYKFLWNFWMGTTFDWAADWSRSNKNLILLSNKPSSVSYSGFFGHN